MRCSNRCANPVLPGRSFFEPTWYQTSTATMGALWSSWTTKVRPLPRTNFLKEISISWANKGAKTNAISSSAVAGAKRERRIGHPLEECITDQWGGPPGLLERACGPRNFMKNGYGDRMGVRRGEVGKAVEKLRPSVCLIRSMRALSE